MTSARASLLRRGATEEEPAPSALRRCEMKIVDGRLRVRVVHSYRPSVVNRCCQSVACVVPRVWLLRLDVPVGLECLCVGQGLLALLLALSLDYGWM